MRRVTLPPPTKLLKGAVGLLCLLGLALAFATLPPLTAKAQNPLAPGISPSRVAPLQPSSAPPDRRITADQNEAAPDDAACSTCAVRCLQNVGAGACIVTVAQTSAGGTIGNIVPAGLAPLDGLGGSWCTSNTGPIYVYRVGGAGTCVMNLQTEVWR